MMKDTKIFEKEFVPFDIAKGMVEELGFDEETLCVFDDEGHFQDEDEMKKFNLHFTKAPTYFQVIDFLTERYGISVYVHNSLLSNFPAQVTFSVFDSDGYKYHDSMMYGKDRRPVYDEAFVHAMNRVVSKKHIELEKNNHKK